MFALSIVVFTPFFLSLMFFFVFKACHYFSCLFLCVSAFLGYIGQRVSILFCAIVKIDGLFGQNIFPLALLAPVVDFFLTFQVKGVSFLVHC